MEHSPQPPCWLRIKPGKTYVMSDLHLGHKNLVELSGRPKDFTERIIEALSKLPKKSTLILVGDVALSKKMASVVSSFPPETKILVKGNHDRIRHYGLDRIFDVICPSCFSRIEVKKNVNLNVYFFHYPVPAEAVSRSIGYHVDYVVSGHTHKPPFYDPEKRIINLSPEVAGYEPFNLLELMKKVLKNKNRRVEKFSEL